MSNRLKKALTIAGIILFFLLGSEFFVNYTIRFNKGKGANK